MDKALAHSASLYESSTAGVIPRRRSTSRPSGTEVPVGRQRREASVGAGRQLSLVRNWGTLKPGSEVRLFSNGREVGAGRVDTPSPDGTVFWVLARDGGRSLVLKADAVAVYTLMAAEK